MGGSNFAGSEEVMSASDMKPNERSFGNRMKPTNAGKSRVAGSAVGQ